VRREFIFNTPKLKLKRKRSRNYGTKEERLLWNQLKGSRLGFKFRRQHSVTFYILDFYCPEKKLAIELDGEQHKQNYKYDLYRTRYLEAFNIKVIRFWNWELQSNLDKVVDRIRNELTPS